MKPKRALLFLLAGMFLSAVVAFNLVCIASPTLPLSIFVMACTILLAAITFPQLAIGLSGSKIVKNLLPVIYRSATHWLFIISQVFLAILAIVAEHSSQNQAAPSQSYRFLVWIALADLFFVLWYLLRLVGRISMPTKMLRAFTSSILTKWSQTDLGDDTTEALICLRLAARIAREANTGYEKSITIDGLERLLHGVSSRVRRRPLGMGDFDETRYAAWKFIVESIAQSCINELSCGDESNTSRAIAVLSDAVYCTRSWPSTGYDYGACPRAVATLAVYALSKGYRNSVSIAAQTLEKLARASMPDGDTPRISPVQICAMLARIGVQAVQVNQVDQTEAYVESLVSLTHESARDTEKYLFYALYLMATVWEKDNDALEDLRLRFDWDEIRPTGMLMLDYGRSYFPRKTRRITRFLIAFNLLSSSLL